MNFDLDGYTTHLLLAGLADSTVREYRSYAIRWGRWCATRNLDPHQPNALRVRAWSGTLPTGVSSRDNGKAAIRYVCLWQDVEDVSGAVGRPEKNARNLRYPLTRPEAQTLMAHAWQSGDQGTAVVIGMTTGMRISEIRKFRWEDIDWTGRTLRFWRTKSSSWHTVPLAPQLGVRLEPFVPERGTGYVLASPTDGYRSCQGLRDWIDTVTAGCGLPWVQPHDLRRTSGRAVYEQADRDITVAQRFLGHTDPRITARYIRADLDGVREALDGISDFWGWGDEDDDVPAAA